MEIGVSNPNPLNIFLVFLAGLLTSLGPCSLSLLPVTIAYIGGSKNEGNNLRILSFCIGVVFSLVCLGAIAGFLGKIYGQVPDIITTSVSIFAIIMGLNLLGVIKLRFPNTPNFDVVKKKSSRFSSSMCYGCSIWDSFFFMYNSSFSNSSCLDITDSKSTYINHFSTILWLRAGYPTFYSGINDRKSQEYFSFT